MGYFDKNVTIPACLQCQLPEINRKLIMLLRGPLLFLCVMPQNPQPVYTYSPKW